MSLTDEQRQERDTTAIQVELLALAEQAQAIGGQLVDAERAYHEALTVKATLKAQATWVKQRTQALQSVLKSLWQG